MNGNPNCSVKNCNRPVRAKTYCDMHRRKYIFMPRHPLYAIWARMIQRCYNKKDPSYPYYGGLGIRVHEPWIRNYHTFARDVGLRPSPRHTVDRIDPKKNYTPDNVQWVTSIQRSMSRQARPDNGSGITGVYWDERFQRWHATITINKRRHHLGRYKTLPEAASARFLAEARYTV